MTTENEMTKEQAVTKSLKILLNVIYAIKASQLKISSVQEGDFDKATNYYNSEKFCLGNIPPLEEIERIVEIAMH